MLTEIYSPGATKVHKTKPSVKLCLLFVVCTSLFLFESWPLLIATSIAVATLYYYSKISVKNIITSIRPALWVLIVIFIAQLFLSGFNIAAFVVTRLMAMILAASLLTLTTRTSDLISTIEAGVRKIASVEVAEAVGLAFSLSFRFIPRVRQTFEDVKEAQRARGLHNSWRALLTPTIVRTLKSADEIAQAINARNVDTSHLKNKTDCHE